MSHVFPPEIQIGHGTEAPCPFTTHNSLLPWGARPGGPGGPPGPTARPRKTIGKGFSSWKPNDFVGFRMKSI